MRKSLISLAAIIALASTFPPLPAPWFRVAASETAAPSGREAIMAAAQAKLAGTLIERLGSRGDTTVSPASLAAAFGIINLGADAAMRTAIAKALGFASAQPEKDLETLSDLRGGLAGSGGSFQSASRIVFAPANAPNAILRAGLDKLGIDYAIDDLSRPEAAARIDAWVKEATQGAIPEILGGPVEKASFVALNALHFKGRWKTPFDPQLTTMTPFKGLDGKSENVAMMRLGPGMRAFRQEHNFVGVNLPFSDERFSLIVVTTTDKPAPAKDFAKVADWLTGAGFANQRGDLALPRFSASGREDLMPVLDALGLDKVRHSATALQGFAPGAMLSQVVQRAMIEVDEEGAEAAAATAVMGQRSLESEDGMHMVVDKPFVYALRDGATGLVLVAGYVGQPPKGKAM